MPKILLVEDNEMNRDMLSRRLVRGGYEVIIAEDGARGVAMASSDRPDLILMDMSLPVIDGWEATRRIKATPELCKIPVIALTAHAQNAACAPWGYTAYNTSYNAAGAQRYTTAKTGGKETIRAQRHVEAAHPRFAARPALFYALSPLPRRYPRPSTG